MLQHFQINISVPGDDITACAGSSNTVQRKVIICDYCYEHFISASVVTIDVI